MWLTTGFLFQFRGANVANKPDPWKLPATQADVVLLIKRLEAMDEEVHNLELMVCVLAEVMKRSILWPPLSEVHRIRINVEGRLAEIKHEAMRDLGLL
jgi:hypothetical protein